MSDTNTGYRPVPLGVITERVHLLRRVTELGGAIQQYASAGLIPLPQWIEELSRISARLQEIEKEKGATT